jgi:hypothetical protein
MADLSQGFPGVWVSDMILEGIAGDIASGAIEGPKMLFCILTF